MAERTAEAVIEARARAHRRSRAPTFYLAMALAFALAAFVGFAPTYYLKSVYGTPELPALVHLHGAMFTAWLAVLIAQTWLVAAGRTDVHRRLGIAGTALAVGMLPVGLAVAVGSAARGFTPPGGPPPLAFFAIPFFGLVSFAGLVGAGILKRRSAEAHKRLMILATAAIIDAAVARWPLPIPLIPPVFFGLTDLFVVAVAVHDLVQRGRLHPATLWAGLWIIAMQAIRLAVMETGPWLDFARWLTGGA